MKRGMQNIWILVSIFGLLLGLTVLFMIANFASNTGNQIIGFLFG